jgi:hypothetical protein
VRDRRSLPAQNARIEKSRPARQIGTSALGVVGLDAHQTRGPNARSEAPSGSHGALQQ